METLPEVLSCVVWPHDVVFRREDVVGVERCRVWAPRYVAEPWLRSGHLVRVLERHEPEPWPIYVYRVQRAPVPARVRLVYDALIEVLR
jgi:DNA-binding transcriptional LysR family regulator